MDNQGRTGGGWILKGTARTGSNQEQSNLYKPFPGFPHLSRTDPEGGSILRGGGSENTFVQKSVFSESERKLRNPFLNDGMAGIPRLGGLGSRW